MPGRSVSAEAQQVLDPETEVEVLVMAYHSYVQVGEAVVMAVDGPWLGVGSLKL